MFSSNAPTVAGYLAALPPDRRAIVDDVRARVNAHLPRGFDECIVYGMIGWVVPLSRYPNTYNGHPLAICALASQKHYVSLYLTGPYTSPQGRDKFEAAYAKTGKKLDMGKSCLRFSSLEDVAWSVVEKSLETLGVDGFIAVYEASRAATKTGQKAAAKKAASESKSVAAPKKATAPKRATAPKKAAAPKKATAPKKAATPKKAAAPKKTAAPKKAAAPKETAAPKKAAAAKKTAAPKKAATPKKAAKRA